MTYPVYTYILLQTNNHWSLRFRMTYDLKVGYQTNGVMSNMRELDVPIRHEANRFNLRTAAYYVSVPVTRYLVGVIQFRFIG
jgi:hypothetical protein